MSSSDLKTSLKANRSKSYMGENKVFQYDEERGSIFQRNTFLRQMRAMMKKNLILQKRFIMGTICECLFPIILIFISCIYVSMFKSALDIEGSPYSKYTAFIHINITIIY